MEAKLFYGKVVWFNDKMGYGFIARTGEKDLFVHWSDIACEGFKTLKKDQEVSFTLGTNHHGIPKATEVRTK